ncbi:MAG TPA: hypothetical protein VK714_02105 [Myxococcota bacterium]|nr:hypothetical protein [Myxococcota bacterium]
MRESIRRRLETPEGRARTARWLAHVLESPRVRVALAAYAGTLEGRAVLLEALGPEAQGGGGLEWLEDLGRG